MWLNNSNTIALYISVRVSIGANFLKDLRMLILADISGIILSICTFHLRFSSVYILTYLATDTLLIGSPLM